MVYEAIFVDVFNMTYRKTPIDADYLAIANAMVNFIEGDIKNHLAKNGKIYLLFDPIPKSDMGMSRNFNYHTTRQEILPKYKKTRTADPRVLNAVKMIRRYYTFKGDEISICISNSLEADDFVEGLLEIETGNVALVSNDSDWARYISERVQMITKSFDEPYTKEAYFNDYGIKPTIATVTLKKAIYGDAADCIPNITKMKKVKFYTNVDDVIENFLMDISRENTPLAELEKQFKKATFRDLFAIKERNATEEFMYTLITEENMYENVWLQFLNNIRVIKCRCKDAKKYIYNKPINTKYNKLMDTTLGRIKSDKPFTFGQVKV